MTTKLFCGAIAAVSLLSATSLQADDFSYNIYVPGITNLYANPTWHTYGWWSGEGGNPIEIPVAGGENVSLTASGIIDYSAVRDPGDSAYGPNGWDHDLAPNGVPYYGMAGVWVSAIDRSQTPYWGLTPIGEVFQVGESFSAIAPDGAVALMLGVTDPNYVVDQADIDAADYYDQSDLGQLDGDGQYFVQVRSSAPQSEHNAPQILPNAVLTADKMTGAAPLTVRFDASESTDDGEIVRYKWNFGDGDKTRDTPQTHTYNSPGTYTVTMTAVDNLSLSNAVSLTINVIEQGQNLPPEAVFNVSAKGFTVSVDASESIDHDGTIAEYAWDFGNDATGTGVKTTHTYEDVGYYTIKLRVSDNVSASSESTHTISLIGVEQIVPEPEPEAEPQPEPETEPEEEVAPETETDTPVTPAAEDTSSGSSGGGGAMGALLIGLLGMRRYLKK